MLCICKSHEKITLHKILLKTSFSAFLPNFGNISAKCRIRQSVVSAKCLYGKVVFGEVSRTLLIYLHAWRENINHTCDISRLIVNLPIFLSLFRRPDIGTKNPRKKKKSYHVFSPTNNLCIFTEKLE